MLDDDKREGGAPGRLTTLCCSKRLTAPSLVAALSCVTARPCRSLQPPGLACKQVMASQPTSVPVTLPSGIVIHISEPTSERAAETSKRLWRQLATAPCWRGTLQYVQNQLRCDKTFGRDGPAALRNAFIKQKPGEGSTNADPTKGGNRPQCDDDAIPAALRPVLCRLRKAEKGLPDGPVGRDLELAKRLLCTALLNLFCQPKTPQVKARVVPATTELSVCGTAAPEMAAEVLVQLLALTPPGTTASLTLGPAKAAASAERKSFTGTKLSVSNLDRGVTETDVRDLFSEMGELQSSRLFDNGVAEVVYKSKQDAMDAINRYHGVPLDGKPMIIKNVDNAENGRGGVLDRLSTGPRGGGGGRRRAASNHKDEWGDQESYCCFRMVGTDGVGMQEAVAWLTHALARPAEKRTQSTRRKRGMDDQAYRISASAKRKRNEVTL